MGTGNGRERRREENKNIYKGRSAEVDKGKGQVTRMNVGKKARDTGRKRKTCCVGEMQRGRRRRGEGGETRKKGIGEVEA